MELKDFIEKFAALFEETDPSEFTGDTYFKELDEWSSLTGLLVIGMVLDEYGKDLKADVLRKCETIEDLFNAVKAL